MTISALNAAELIKVHSARIYFLSVALSGTPFYACTGTKTYVFGDNDYLGIGEIASLGEFADASDGTARQLTLSLSGVDAAITEPLLSRVNYKNAAVNIYRGFLDTNEDMIDDPDVVWSGRADVGSVAQYEGAAVATLTCEPDAARLLRANVSRYADEDHQLRWPADVFFQELAEMERKDVLWGGMRVSPTTGGRDFRGGQFGDGSTRAKF